MNAYTPTSGVSPIFYPKMPKQKDKIIQIMIGEGDVILGLSQSGSIYVLEEKGHIENLNSGTPQYISRWVADSIKWIKKIDSPDKKKGSDVG